VQSRALKLFSVCAGTNPFLARNAPQRRGDNFIAAKTQAATLGTMVPKVSDVALSKI
jgi:hypothetical protein